MFDPRFSRFVLASGLTNTADGIATLAWAWLASLLTRDPLLIALVPVALRLLWFLCALPAGIVTDRVDRRLLILRMDALRAVVFGGVALAVWSALPLAPATATGSPGWLFYILLASAGLIGVAEVFRDNAAQTMLPALVARQDLEKANGRLWSVELVGNSLVGPALGAFLIAAALPLPFAANALAFVAALALILRLPGAFRAPRHAPPDWRRELAEAFAFLKANILLRNLALITGSWNLVFQMAMIALVLHVQENLHLDARAYGLILATGAVGGILGGTLGARIIDRLGPARTAQWSLAASAPAFLAIAVAPGPWSLAVTLAAFEFTGIVWNTVSVSYRQRAIPDAMLGRVNSLYRLLAWGTIPLGMVLSGLLTRLADTALPRCSALTAPFFTAALGAMLITLVAWRALARGFGAPQPR